DIPVMLQTLTDVDQYRTDNLLTAADVLTIGNLNQDGVFDNRDIQAMLNKLITGQFQSPIPPGVPEPPAIVLAGLGLIGVGLMRRGCWRIINSRRENAIRNCL